MDSPTTSVGSVPAKLDNEGSIETPGKATVTDSPTILASSGQQRHSNTRDFIRRFFSAAALLDYVILIAAGAALGIQAGANSRLAVLTDGYFTSFICQGVGMVVLSAMAIVDYMFFHKTTMAELKSADWWEWSGFVWGVLFVVLNTLALVRLGPAEVLGIVVGAQLITACVIDHFGWLHMPKRKLSIWRALGVLILIASIVVMVLW
ncbi:DUF606-domain-containing protein [Linderina pennispora]|uniref:DUF606-domain-containing protein n=1 Tax=Linderina pennispora TaxID=61395 RepID=A0A1Y1W2V5_9FUNG|nr:DUF606-domain-containing protein [Linderina pennispora]ORX67606.1 DUF606-domain-containing protein [Linderina pennispora]